MKKLTLNLLALLAALASTAALAQVTPLGAIPPRPSPPPALAPGLYVSVTEGLIKVSNQGGATTFAAGQFGYTASPVQPPAPILKNPVPLSLPVAFAPLPGGSGAGSPTKAAAIDCVVR